MSLRMLDSALEVHYTSPAAFLLTSLIIMAHELRHDSEGILAGRKNERK